ncbi:hypothetical protein CEXT_58531 [Caerostris extrusa]|uniref:Uncharacterized protein n=1 Tax=Caerostris extrusa TaxID=172846 RepID=A0AAV4U069_CAEEX|nr:hypothetical protein CEXT_58531 [Caerostris extrusa]
MNDANNAEDLYLEKIKFSRETTCCGTPADEQKLLCPRNIINGPMCRDFQKCPKHTATLTPVPLRFKMGVLSCGRRSSALLDRLLLVGMSSG